MRLLPARLRGRPLAPGAYRLTAVAVDSAGGQSEPRTASFKVKKKKPGRTRR